MIICLSAPLLAQTLSEQEYINQLAYQRSKLELMVKKRIINENRSYSYTDIESTTYTWESYSHTSSDISTQSLSRAEAKEVTDWYVYKGGVRELSDLELLELAGDTTTLPRLRTMEDQKGQMRLIGNVSIGVGLLAMIGGAAFSAEQPVISGGAVATVLGFFISAFNQSPHHYIQPDFAQEKIDDYNIALKRRLDLPLDYK
jgi:hypothetical protein